MLKSWTRDETNVESFARGFDQFEVYLLYNLYAMMPKMNFNNFREIKVYISPF